MHISSASRQFSMEGYVRRPLAAIYIFFALTPWTSWGTNDLDSQPWPLLVGILYIITTARWIRVNLSILLALFMISLGFPIALLLEPPETSFLLIRGIATYATFGLALIIFYDIARNYQYRKSLIIFINYLWLAAAIAEIFLPELIEALGQRRTTENRGMTSLAPEPTYFAVYLIFSSWILLVIYDYKLSRHIKILLILNIIAIITLAMSTMGLLFVLIAIFFIVLYNILRLKKMNLYILGAVIIIVFTMPFLFSLDAIKSSRMGYIASRLSWNSVTYLAKYDASINTRMQNLIIPLHATANSYLIPRGLSNYTSIRDEVLPHYGGFFFYLQRNDRIQSWIGSLFLELGIFGILAFISLLCGIFDKNRRVTLFEIPLLVIYLLAAVPIAFTPVPFLISLLIHRKERSEVREENDEGTHSFKEL